MQLTQEQTCGNCRWWKDAGDHIATPQCRRYPPNAEMQVRFNVWGWPTTYETDFCGEHQAKEQPDGR